MGVKIIRIDSVAHRLVRELIADCFRGFMNKGVEKYLGAGKNGRARGRHARVESLARPVLSLAHYFQAPATQAILNDNK